MAEPHCIAIRGQALVISLFKIAGAPDHGIDQAGITVLRYGFHQVRPVVEPGHLVVHIGIVLHHQQRCLRAFKVQCPPQAIIDITLAAVGQDQLKTGSVGKFCSVIQGLAVLDLDPGLHQQASQAGVVGDPGRAIDGGLNHVRFITRRSHEAPVGIGAGFQQQAGTFHNRIPPSRVRHQQARLAGIHQWCCLEGPLVHIDAICTQPSA